MQQYLCCRVYRAGHELLETRMFILVYCLLWLCCLMQCSHFKWDEKLRRTKFFPPSHSMAWSHLKSIWMCECVFEFVMNKSLNFPLSRIKLSSGTKTYDSLTSSSSTTPSKSRLHFVRGCGSVFLKETVRSNGTPFFALCETWKGIISAKLKIYESVLVQ